MRHLVNFSLLFVFAALAISGSMLFVLPFTLKVVRVHILFALATVGLVVLHLASRLSYFRSSWRPRAQGGLRTYAVASLAVTGGLLLAAAANWRPVDWLVEQGYESRWRREIVRPSALAGFHWEDAESLIVSRAPADDNDLRVSLLVRLAQRIQPPPAIAVWAETTAGAMIETLYVDPRVAYSDHPSWYGAPIDRSEVLPIWRRRYALVSGMAVDGNVDATTGATPRHSFSLDDYLIADKEDAIIICVELNAGHDPNDAYPDPRLGQPSLLYTAYLEPHSEEPYAILKLTAHGGDTHTGVPRYDLHGITTAKQLVDLLLAKVELHSD
ncbi:MAG: hypothetical protein CMJ58_07940 [Planctomycetaceae bacterium]|nr:hypothetical protein [Planctomycetaceae bacterium]